MIILYPELEPGQDFGVCWFYQQLFFCLLFGTMIMSALFIR